MKVYFIRHTRVDVPVGVCYGSSDVGLFMSYPDEKKEILKKINLPTKALVFSSPLLRCKQLAHDLFSDVILDERLKEYHFGEWELKKWDDISEESIHLWSQDIVANRPPNGENMEELSERAVAFWNNLKNTQYSENQIIYVFSHAGFIRVILCYLLEIPLHNAFRIGLDYGSVSQVSVYEKYITVDYINR